ncbi:biotin--[acetyl-CoA-carboxylase] ligase [Aestuariibius sp. HNIBRBA575]|uniref:biotin--[acetyl-CoA-carboxylase] ligase n=1 Tax=Aestuariibius sp. HNIBRBA575 TaxID=3233343 RepID=UPI0034A575FB
MAEASRRVGDITRPTWILAHEQTRGRGRRGRVWANPKGNLAATLIYRPNVPPAEAAKRSFVMANALYSALADFVPDYKLAVKWPNDVLLAGGKIAGILLESSGQGGQVDWLSIGVGVNLSNTPENVHDSAFPPVALSSETDAPDAETFLTHLAATFAAREARMVKHGFDGIRTEWLRHAARKGEVITARTTQEDIAGIFDDVDDDGNLILITARGTRVIPAADIFF